MFKLLYVLGGAVLGAVIVENNQSAKTAVAMATTKVRNLLTAGKTRIADMEL